MKDIRHQTRHHISAENKNRVVLEGLRGNESTVELCCKDEIARSLYP